MERKEYESFTGPKDDGTGYLRLVYGDSILLGNVIKTFKLQATKV